MQEDPSSRNLQILKLEESGLGDHKEVSSNISKKKILEDPKLKKARAKQT